MSDRDRQVSEQHVRDANKRLAAEIDRLAAEVERLRMTDAEREAIDDCAHLAVEAYMNGDIAATLRALRDRHARETVGKRQSRDR
jgi:hypothetical protein